MTKISWGRRVRTQSPEYLECDRKPWIFFFSWWENAMRHRWWKVNTQGMMKKLGLYTKRKIKTTWGSIEKKWKPRLDQVLTCYYRKRNIHRCAWRIASRVWARDTKGNSYTDSPSRMKAVVWILYWHKAYYLWTLGARRIAYPPKYDLTRYGMLFWMTSDSVLYRNGWNMASASKCGI